MLLDMDSTACDDTACILLKLSTQIRRRPSVFPR
jgi:hypothetical protein